MKYEIIKIKYAIWHFFTDLRSGAIPWEYYLEDLKKEDFGLALRIEEDLAMQNRGIAIMITIAVLIISIFAIAIIRNQIKIKKMLKKMMEEKEEGESSAKDTK